jgi:hypothetical protein
MSCGSVGSAVRGFRLVNRRSAYGLRPTARELRPKQPGVGRTQDKRPQGSQEAPSCMTRIRRWPGIATCLTIIRPFLAKLTPEGGTERLRRGFLGVHLLLLKVRRNHDVICETDHLVNWRPDFNRRAGGSRIGTYSSCSFGKSASGLSNHRWLRFMPRFTTIYVLAAEFYPKSI